MTRREATLGELAQLITRLEIQHPVRVAIDGRTASGKTILADELASAIEKLGRLTIRTSIDGFHRPKAQRYVRGRFSAESYYFDARDLSAVRTLLLDPLGPDGDRWYRTASFDLDIDIPIDQPPRAATDDTILIVDGTFLQRPELAGGWDYVVFVKTSEADAERRGLGRDTEKLGGEQVARKLYAERYRPAFSLYERLCQPETKADIVIDNTDLDHPLLLT